MVQESDGPKATWRCPPKGYRQGDRILRPAKVAVSHKRASRQSPGGVNDDGRSRDYYEVLGQEDRDPGGDQRPTVSWPGNTIRCQPDDPKAEFKGLDRIRNPVRSKRKICDMVLDPVRAGARADSANARAARRWAAIGPLATFSAAVASATLRWFGGGRSSRRQNAGCERGRPAVVRGLTQKRDHRCACPGARSARYGAAAQRRALRRLQSAVPGSGRGRPESGFLR